MAHSAGLLWRHQSTSCPCKMGYWRAPPITKEAGFWFQRLLCSHKDLLAESMYTNRTTKEGLEAIDAFIIETKGDSTSLGISEQLIQVWGYLLAPDIWYGHGYDTSTSIGHYLLCITRTSNDYTMVSAAVFLQAIHWWCHWDLAHWPIPNTRRTSLVRFQQGREWMLGLTWICETPSQKVDFTDMQISIVNNRIETNLCKKALNLYLYIPLHSSHPCGVFTGLILVQILHIQGLCSKH